MAKKFTNLRDELVGKVGEDRLQEAEQAARVEQAVYQHRLRELRHALALTQKEMADRLGVSQANVSKLEARDDVYLSTLAGYVEAAGGRLEVKAIFGDGIEVPVVERDVDEHDDDGDTQQSPTAEHYMQAVKEWMGLKSSLGAGSTHGGRIESMDDVDLPSTTEGCFPDVDHVRVKRDTTDRCKGMLSEFQDTRTRGVTPPNVDSVPILPSSPGRTENKPTKDLAGLEILKLSKDNPWVLLMWVVVGAIVARRALRVEVRGPQPSCEKVSGGAHRKLVSARWRGLAYPTAVRPSEDPRAAHAFAVVGGAHALPVVDWQDHDNPEHTFTARLDEILVGACD